MNTVFHFLFSYVFVDFITGGNAWNYILVIFVFSVAIDLTHIPYLLKKRGRIVNERFGSGSRTRFHEMYGLVLFSFLLCIIFFFTGPVLAGIAALCLLLHFSIDFISGKSMPFYPYSDREVFLGMMPYGYRNKIVFEIAATLIFGVLFWLSIGSLVL